MHKLPLTFVALAFLATQSASAYSVVQLSTGVPTSIETQFIAATTTQFNAFVTKNPFVSNTYSIKIYGTNPSYNQPLTAQQVIDSFLKQDYIYGFADGMTYQQQMEEGLVGGYENNCSTPTLFNLEQTSTDTWDSKTCGDALGTIEYWLFQQSLSTPTVIPGLP